MQTSIQDVKRAHEAQFMALPGVVSVGIGRGEDGEAVIVIGLDGERPETQRQLPKQVDGYEVRTEIVGKIKAT